METDKIKEIIDRALADGILSRAESDIIKTAIYANGHPVAEHVELFRKLQEKVWQGQVLLGD